MKIDKLEKEIYGRLRKIMIAVPQGNRFSVLHSMSASDVETLRDRETLSIMNLYASLAGTSDLKLNLMDDALEKVAVENPTQMSIFGLEDEKKVYDFEMRKGTILNRTNNDGKVAIQRKPLIEKFYVEKLAENEGRVFSACDHTFGGLVVAMAKSFAHKLADKSVDEQKEFLRVLAQQDAMELVDTSRLACPLFSDAEEFPWMKSDSLALHYDAVFYHFTHAERNSEAARQENVKMIKRVAAEEKAKAKESGKSGEEGSASANKGDGKQ